MVRDHIKHSLWLWLALAAAIAAPGAEVGSAACAPCHAAIARSYAATGMARSAGRAAPVGLPARVGAYELTGQGPDGIRLVLPGAPGAGGPASPAVERRLNWFIGSGHAGRSYLFGVDGFLFQAPVSYFAASKSWLLSPGFELLRSGQFTRAVEPSCLQCHTSRLRHRDRTVNAFADPPFLEGGVSCERCHGEGDRHASNPQAVRMVNPARLAPDRRDSICEQCHLTGAARVAHAGAGEARYRPGDRLADSLAVFVWKDRAAATGATGHTDGLAQSQCAQKSGPGRLSCLSCHDPHAEPAPAARPAFYRARCERCHAAGPSACSSKQGRTDCIACHMPRRATPTTDHLAFTDHSIPRVTPPKSTSAAPASPSELVSFWRGEPVQPRDLALAYAIAAGSRPAALAMAGKLLAGFDPPSAAAASASDDAPLLLELAQWHERQGRPERARPLYERVIELNPAATSALVNLGGLLMKSGDAEGAEKLWRDALARNPGLTAARLNLGMAQYRAGRRDEAIATLRTALAFEPRLEPARRLLAEMGAAPAAAKPARR